MATISARVDKHLRDKLSSKAVEEGVSTSDLIKGALDRIEFDKQESKGGDKDSKAKENVRDEVKEAVAPLQRRTRELEKRIATLEEIDAGLYDIAKSLLKIARQNKREHSKIIDKSMEAVTRDVLATDKSNARIRNRIRKNRTNLELIQRDLLDVQHRLMNKGLEVVEGVAKRLR